MANDRLCEFPAHLHRQNYIEDALRTITNLVIESAGISEEALSAYLCETYSLTLDEAMVMIKQERDSAIAQVNAYWGKVA